MPRKTTSHRAIDVAVETLTPADAKELLAKNELNRALRPNVVDAYRRDMETGRWSFTAEPIQVSRTDRLLNGQHRLAALAEANIKTGLDFVVARGLPDQAQAAMDQGVARTAKDALTMAGHHVKNAPVVAAICRWLACAPTVSDLSRTSLGRRVSNAEIVELYASNPDVHPAAELAVRLRGMGLVPGGPSPVGYAALHMSRADRSAANEFWAGLTDMEWSWKNDPRKAALRRLQGMFADDTVTASRETGIMTVSVLTRAWNAWRRNEEVETIQLRGKAGIVPPVEPI